MTLDQIAEDLNPAESKSSLRRALALHPGLFTPDEVRAIESAQHKDKDAAIGNAVEMRTVGESLRCWTTGRGRGRIAAARANLQK